MTEEEKKIDTLVKKINKIKSKILTIEAIRPGSLSKQYNICGNPTCKCKADPPQKHGPYYNLSYTRKGKGGTRFIKGDNIKIVKKQTDDYKKLKSLIDEWIDLGMELSDLKLIKNQNTRD